MQVRFALIALAGTLSLSALAGPYMTPLGKTQSPAVRSSIASSAVSTTAAGWRFVGGEQGYEFIDSPSTLTRAEFLRQQAAPAAAGTRDGWIAVGGQEGARFVPQATSVSRAQVQHDALHARHVPSSVDGWVVVGGEAGAVYVDGAASKDALQAFAPAGYFGIGQMLMPDGTPCTMAANGDMPHMAGMAPAGHHQ